MLINHENPSAWTLSVEIMCEPASRSEQLPHGTKTKSGPVYGTMFPRKTFFSFVFTQQWKENCAHAGENVKKDRNDVVHMPGF